MLTLTKRKGSPYWYVRGTVGGQEIFKSTGCTRKLEAEKRARKLEDALEADLENIGRKTFGEAIDAYIEQGGEARFLEVIKERIGDLPAEEIDQELIDDLALELFAPGRKASYIRRALYDPVTTVLNFVAKRKWIPYQKIKKPKKIRPAPSWATPEWFDALWNHCSPSLALLTNFLAYTGCRISEALNIDLENDVNWDHQEVYVRETKTDVPRTVFVPDHVWEDFVKLKGGKGRAFPEWGHYCAVNQALRRACKRAGIKYLSTHKVGSHTYATQMRRYGTDLRGLVGTGRWKSIDSVMIYTHTSATEDAKGAARIPPVRAKSVQPARKGRRKASVPTFGT
jgi:integrase